MNSKILKLIFRIDIYRYPYYKVLCQSSRWRFSPVLYSFLSRTNCRWKSSVRVESSSSSKCSQFSLQMLFSFQLASLKGSSCDSNSLTQTVCFLTKVFSVFISIWCACSFILVCIISSSIFWFGTCSESYRSELTRVPVIIQL